MFTDDEIAEVTNVMLSLLSKSLAYMNKFTTLSLFMTYYNVNKFIILVIQVIQL